MQKQLEQWEHWQTNQLPEKELIIDSFIDRTDGFKIRLVSEEEEWFEIDFGPSVIFYKVTDEICTLVRASNIVKHQGKDFFANRNFFVATKSCFINDLADRTNAYSSKETPLHFVLFDDDFMIDVVSIDKPIIRQVEQ